MIEEPKGYFQSWKRVNQNEFRYEINFGTTSFESEIKDYTNLFEEYSLLKTKMENNRTALSEAKAKELWEEA